MGPQFESDSLAAASAPAMGAAPPSRKARLVRAGLATVTGQSANILITMASTVVLARLLEVSDFGLLAMVYTLLSFINSFRDFGLPMAALQSRKLGHLESSALFWTNLPVSLLATLFMVLMGPVLAWFYGEPRLILLTAVMSTGLLASTMANQHEALMTRQLRFVSLASLDLLFHVVGAATAIVLALLGAGYWALAAQYIAWQGGRALAVVLLSGWMPSGWRASREARRQVRHLVSFGAYLTGFRVISSLRDLDRVLIGYLSGKHALGLYDAAFKWARLPIRQVFTPLLGPAVAGLSHVRDDPAAYRHNARAILTPVLACSIPALIYAAVFAHPLIMLLLGQKWAEAVPLFRWLCIGAIAHAAHKTTKWFYVSMGNTKKQFRWGLVSTPIFVIAIAASAPWGPYAVAIAYAATAWALLIPGLAYCLHDAPLRLGQYMSVMARPLAKAVIAAGIAAVVVGQVGAQSSGAQFAISAPLFALVYAGLWLALPGGRAAVADAVRLVQSVRGRRPAPLPLAAAEAESF